MGGKKANIMWCKIKSVSITRKYSISLLFALQQVTITLHCRDGKPQLELDLTWRDLRHCKKLKRKWNCWGDPKKITKEVSGRAGKTASDSQATAYGKRLVCYQQRPWFILSVQCHLLLNSCCQSFSLFEKTWRKERSTLPWETVYSFLDMTTLTAYTFSFSNFTPSHLIFYLQQP